MKKYIALVLTLVCILGLVGFAIRSDGATPSEHKRFNFENVSKLIVISVDGKRYEITDTDTVQQIIENIESIQFEKGESSENTNGFGPFIQWYDANGNLIESISVMAEETILYDGFFWTAIDGNIDYTALNQILGNVNQDTENIGTDTDVASSLDGVTMEVAEHSDAGASVTPQPDISIASFWDREGAVLLSAEDAAVIADLVGSESWMEGTGDCLDDCIIFMDGEEIQYHSDCGTFNDTVNEKSLHLTEEQQTEVNAILEKYISLEQGLSTSPGVEEKPAQSAGSSSTPQNGTIQDGKIYILGFGWVDYEGGGTEGIYAEDMYENGNTIGTMD